MIYHAIGKPSERVARYTSNPSVVVLDTDQVIVQVGDLPTVQQTVSADGLSVIAYVHDLDEVKAMKWSAALAYRNARQTGTCTTPLGVVQIDPDSKQNISGAV